MFNDFITSFWRKYGVIRLKRVWGYARPLGPDLDLTAGNADVKLWNELEDWFWGQLMKCRKLENSWSLTWRIHRCLMADQSHHTWPNKLGLGNLFKNHRRFRKRTPKSAEVWIEKHWQESIWFTKLTIEVPVRSVRALSLKPTLGRNMSTQNMDLIYLKRVGQHGVLRVGASLVSQQLTDFRKSHLHSPSQTGMEAPRKGLQNDVTIGQSSDQPVIKQVRSFEMLCISWSDQASQPTQLTSVSERENKFGFPTFWDQLDSVSTVAFTKQLAIA